MLAFLCLFGLVFFSAGWCIHRDTVRWRCSGARARTSNSALRSRRL